MITDKETNIVYFSSLLEKNFNQIFKKIESIFEGNGLRVKLLKSTKDIWARDYMPIQVDVNHYIRYNYNPDYLREKKYDDIRSDTQVVCDANDIKTTFLDLIIDGGNVIKSKNKVILTDKIYTENTGRKLSELNRVTNEEKDKIKKKLLVDFEVKDVIIIPHQPYDYFGHADGMVRFIDDETILVNDFSDSDVSKSFLEKLYGVFGMHGLYIIHLPYKFYPEISNEKGETTAIGCYINFLQVGEVILFPKFCEDEELDNSAYEKTRQIYKNKAKVYQVECRDIAIQGGVLNCISWNIKA